ncbi:potassium channel family protein [Candidatus Gracilibacteria bacterium]|nr:potassium channel family protein [Candidatus Gracilibacteria bacterium]
MLHLHHKKLINIAVVFMFSWLLGTFFIHRFEAGYPIGESYFNAFYFTVITTATIGFGDLVPMTIAGKILTMGYAIFYVPLFLYAMNIVFQSNFQRMRIQDELLEQEMRHVEADVNAILNNSDGRKKKHTSKNN